MSILFKNKNQSRSIATSAPNPIVEQVKDRYEYLADSIEKHEKFLQSGNSLTKKLAIFNINEDEIKDLLPSYEFIKNKERENKRESRTLSTMKYFPGIALTAMFAVGIVGPPLTNSYTFSSDDTKQSVEFLQTGFIEQFRSPEDDGPYADYIRQVKNATKNTKPTVFPLYNKSTENDLEKIRNEISNITIPQSLSDKIGLDSNKEDISFIARIVYGSKSPEVKDFYYKYKANNDSLDNLDMSKVKPVSANIVSSFAYGAERNRDARFLLFSGFAGSLAIPAALRSILYSLVLKRRKNELEAIKSVFAKEFGNYDPITIEAIKNSITLDKKAKNIDISNNQKQQLASYSGYTQIIEEGINEKFEAERIENERRIAQEKFLAEEDSRMVEIDRLRSTKKKNKTVIPVIEQKSSGIQDVVIKRNNLQAINLEEKYIQDDLFPIIINSNYDDNNGLMESVREKE